MRLGLKYLPMRIQPQCFDNCDNETFLLIHSIFMHEMLSSLNPRWRLCKAHLWFHENISRVSFHVLSSTLWPITYIKKTVWYARLNYFHPKQLIFFHKDFSTSLFSSWLSSLCNSNEHRVKNINQNIQLI